MTTRDVAPGGTIREAQPTVGAAHRFKVPVTDWEGASSVTTFPAVGSAGTVRGTLMSDARQKPNAFKHTVPDEIVKLYESPLTREGAGTSNSSTEPLTIVNVRGCMT